MTTEEKAKAYDKALERAQKAADSGMVSQNFVDDIFQLRESEDERIRKVLIHIVKGACSKYGTKYGDAEITEEMLLAYLEKQKEQKPAEWSEEDWEALDIAIINIEDMPEEDVYAGYRMNFGEVARRLKSLRPQSHWRPSEDDFESLSRLKGSMPDI